MKEKNISSLLERYEQMLTSGKSVYFDADEYDELADYYDKLDEIETAKEIIRLGLSIHPNNESLMLRHAKFLTYDANYSLALQYLNTHFTNYDFEQYLLKIECLLQLGLYAEAHTLTMEVLQDEETDTEIILAELGFLYLEAEHFNEAALYFEKSLEYDPDNIEVLNDLAYIHETQGNFEAAINICERILDIDPYLFEIWLMLGKLHSLEENYEKAIDAFDFALTLDDSNTGILKLKAHCLLLADRLEETIEVLQQCIGIYPEDPTPYLTLIECYINLELLDKARIIIDEYENNFGETSESMILKASIFFFTGDNVAAEEIIKKVIDKEEDSFLINKNIGNIYSKVNQPDKAEEFYLKALSKENDEFILEKIVSLYIKKPDFLSAILYQKKLIELNPNSFAYKKLALLYLETSNKESFDSLINSFDDETLLSFFQIFYPDENMEINSIDREYTLRRLDDVYQSRLLYKNIKY